MLCRIARRAISRSEDRGEKAPRWAERHAARCAPCRDYARFAASLKARLAAEKAAFLEAVPEFPLNETAWARPEAGGERRASFRRRLALRPLPAAAAAIVLLAAGLVLWQVVLRDPRPSSEDRAAALASLRSIAAAPESLPGVILGPESSLAREREILERSIASAVEYLQARLNIKIERRTPPAKSS
jgi:hypothetical protein